MLVFILSTSDCTRPRMLDSLVICWSFISASSSLAVFNFPSSSFFSERVVLVMWGQIFILDFAYISRKFPSDPRLFSPESEEISTPPPY
jgi:hypothetical protein